MRTVTLEFLRHGPPHGHLLSPLARYMALCGSHEPADVSVPFDHAELLTRLRALLYKDSDETRDLQLAETARAISNVLASVPGLVAELAESADQAGPTHLRIIFNANELALLPFELANSPSAFPGAGQSLALQPQVPICITREVRRATMGAMEWPSAPRILFASSSAGGDIPAEQHLLALRAVIEPWVSSSAEGDEEEWKKRIDDHLTFFPAASVENLLDACSSGGYTHVHLLAHGVPMDRDDGRRYGLALHGSQGSTAVDVVDGARLATLLRSHVKGRINVLARPAVVSIAACDSGNVGSVIGAGASIAHALHEAGIPLVVASQFPLSFAGSVVMTQVLYEGLLSGSDPRLLLIDVRRQLKTRVRETHDWASVVAYASFPADLDQQIASVRISQADRSIDAAVSHADRATQALLSGEAAGSIEREELLDMSKRKLRQAMDRMLAVLETPLADKARVHGRLARAEKRKADVFWGASKNNPKYLDEALAALEKSGAHYRKSFEADRSQTWALVQAMVIAFALDGAAALDEDEMNLARLLSLEDANSDDRQRRAWAYGNALELELLAGCAPDRLKGTLPPWTQSVRELVRAVGADAPEVQSTRRQLSRWIEFFHGVRTETAQRKSQGENENQLKEVIRLAHQMVSGLPEPPNFP